MGLVRGQKGKMNYSATHTIHRCPPDEFETLSLKYPTGEYGQNDSGSTVWFEVDIPEMNLRLVWFKEAQ